MVYLDEHVENLNIEAALAEVSAQRREQALRFCHDLGRRLNLAAYLLLKEGLRKEYGITENPVFEYSPEGKPSIAGHPDLYFNLSHSKNVALCVISDRPVGADVEVPRKISGSLVAYTMSDAEKDWIYASEDVETAFLELWTRKEAVLKLTGKGIRHDLKRVLDDVGKYRVSTIRTPNCIYSIAQHPAPAPPVSTN